MDKLCNIEFEILKQLSQAEGTVETIFITHGIEHYNEILNYLLFKGYIWSHALEDKDFEVGKTNITMLTFPTHYFITPAGLAAYYVEKECREAEALSKAEQSEDKKKHSAFEIITISISVLALVSSILFRFF